MLLNILKFKKHNLTLHQGINVYFYITAVSNLCTTVLEGHRELILRAPQLIQE